MGTVDASLKKFKLGLVLVAGTAASIPGMKVLGQIELPSEARQFLPFILGTFSAAVVLIVYILRDEVVRWSKWLVAGVAAGCLGIVVVAYICFQGLINFVWVPHSWRLEPSHEFIPLFLSDTAQRLIDQAGSRSQLLSSKGPDVLAPFTTESNVAFTLAALIGCYLVIVVALAVAFTLLLVKASQPARAATRSAHRSK